MDVPIGMIDQRHCVAFFDTGIPASGNESNAETVARGADRFYQDFVVTGGHLAGQNGDRSFGFDLGENRHEQPVHRDQITPFWVCQFALGIRHQHFQAIEIQVAHQDRRLGDAAAGEDLDFGRDSHPRGATDERGAGGVDLLVCQLRFFFCRFPADAELYQDVLLYVLAPARFVEQEGKKLDLVEGGVEFNLLPAPFDILAAVLVTNLAGMMKAIEVQPLPQAFPGMAGADSGRSPRVMGIHKGADPFTERAAGDNRDLSAAFLLGEFLRLAGLRQVIAKKLCRFFPPLAGIGIAETDEPEF